MMYHRNSYDDMMWLMLWDDVESCGCSTFLTISLHSTDCGLPVLVQGNVVAEMHHSNLQGGYPSIPSTNYNESMTENVFL